MPHQSVCAGRGHQFKVGWRAGGIHGMPVDACSAAINVYILSAGDQLGWLAGGYSGESQCSVLTRWFDIPRYVLLSTGAQKGRRGSRRRAWPQAVTSCVYVEPSRACSRFVRLTDLQTVDHKRYVCLQKRLIYCGLRIGYSKRVSGSVFPQVSRDLFGRDCRIFIASRRWR